MRSPTDSASRREKPWVDNECKKQQIMVVETLRIAKNKNFSPEYKHKFIIEKRKFSKILYCKKSEYRKSIVEKVSSCNQSSQFWKIINKTRSNNCQRNDIDIPTWYEFLQYIFPTISTTESPQLNLRISIPFLDDLFKTDEIVKCLQCCKDGGAPGTDGISYGFYKSLRHTWILFVEHFFNKILSSEIIPVEWGNLHTTMIIKKGDPNDSESHRPITLVNC